MSRLDIIDASFHYASKDVSRDQYVLFAFEQREITPTPLEDIIDFIGERADRIPDLAKRIQETPLNLDYPRWIRDDTPASSKVAELSARTWYEVQRTLDRLVQEPVDATKAAWRVHVARDIEGVPHAQGNAVVAIFQVSHALADGRGASRLARRLFAPTPSASLTSRNKLFSPGRVVPVAIASALALPFRLASGRASAWSAKRKFARERGSAPIERDTPRPAIRGNSNPTRNRAVHVIPCKTGSLSGSTFSVTTVALTAVGLATERYLDSVGDTPPDTLNALVPMALPDGTPWPAVNRIVNGTVDLHLEVDDLTDRATLIRTSLSESREEVTDPSLLGWITAENRVPAPAFLAVQKRRAKNARSGHSSQETVHSNVTVVSVDRGASNLELCGAPALFSGGFPMLGPARSLSHGFYGLGDTVTVCVIACPDTFPDHVRYAAVLKQAVDDVTKATTD